MSEAFGRVAFIGLGVMGYPMAGHLAKQASAVTVFNRTAAKANQWVQDYGGSQATCASVTTPKAAAAAADIVFVCVGNDDDVAEVVLGADGALAGMSPGSLLVDHTPPLRLWRRNWALPVLHSPSVFWMRQCPADRQGRRTVR